MKNETTTVALILASVKEETKRLWGITGGEIERRVKRGSLLMHLRALVAEGKLGRERNADLYYVPDGQDGPPWAR